jgi:hypothetical protein
MYEPVFDDSINNEDLSDLENFTSLHDLINAGGIKAERAKKIVNQFSSTSVSKTTRESSSFGTESASKAKKQKFYHGKRFKN